ncbi:M56 family metallopeptidase [Roseimaritima ulvae]|uniref:BlaR1 peptidase M56 n=1 Tax=Roseimaritima ulvae TaxID=980254 RepID=A0A5B9R1D6_9BACT|nr:M56 family metallopeptidase [Roseimaritima ulvae]QEG43605.1 BlaR1 peptidase M56 [Roseimaritima ulvae]
MTFPISLVVSNLLVAALIAALALLVGRSGRRAVLAHLLWVAVFIKLVTPPIFRLPLLSIEPAWLPSLDLSLLLGSVWLLGFVSCLVRGVIRSLRFQRLLRREGIRDDEASAFVASLINPPSHSGSRQTSDTIHSWRRADHSSLLSQFRKHLPSLSVWESRAPARRGRPLRKEGEVEPMASRSRQTLDVLRVPLRLSPMLFGFPLRPVIVCPDPLWSRLTTTERHAFLAHETAHYRRRDHWVRWLEWLVTSAYWWFPGMQLARQQLERHEEACCDAWAVEHLDATPRQYAEALLKVVDFISEHAVGIPRIASGMRPTDSLEERLRLLMQRGREQHDSQTLSWFAGTACVALLAVHPMLRREPLSLADNNPAVTQQANPQHSAESSASLPAGSPQPLSLPNSDIPQGFWNQSPPPQWASFSLGPTGTRLVADVEGGIRIDGEQHPTLSFAMKDLQALVEIPSTKRLVIGNHEGNIQLWDLAAAAPVSLIGKHPACVTSLAYHESGGLVSADQAGAVIRWDLQSGQILARWAESDRPVQSVRYARDGQTMMILCGRWNDAASNQQTYLVHSRTLQTLDSWTLHDKVAVVLDSHADGWVSVDWSGTVRRLETSLPADTWPKELVSSLVLSQDSQPPWEPQ